MSFNDIIATAAISFGVLFLISQVTAVVLMRKNAKKEERNQDFAIFLNMVILPSLCIIYGVAYLFYKVEGLFSFLPLPCNKEERKAREERKHYKAEQKEFDSLSDDELMFRGTRRSIESNLYAFNFCLKNITPDAAWEEARKREVLPEDLNVIFQYLIDASVEFSLLEVSQVSVKEDISKERRALETAYESMKSALMEHELIGEERAEQFIVDEVNADMLAFSLEASENVATEGLRNPAFDYFHASRLLRGETVDHL